ncbi:hypothetical protein BH18ACT15_BH18ACT15_11870 [soil metagenome]
MESVAPSRDRFADLEKAVAESFPESWIPEHDGDTIVGTFVRLDSGTTRYGQSPIVILDTAQGERSVWLIHVVLRNEFKRQQPKAGEPVAVRYLGKKQGAEGQSYAAYRVKVQRDHDDWDALASEDDGAADVEPWD